MGHISYLPVIPRVLPTFHLLSGFLNKKRLGLGRRLINIRQIYIISTKRISYERNWGWRRVFFISTKFFSCFILFVKELDFSLFPGFLSQFISQSLIHVVFYRIAQSHVTSFLWRGGMRAEDERRGYHGMKMMFILTSCSARKQRICFV